MLRSLKNGVLYNGSTQDMERRLITHNKGLVTYSTKTTPWEMVLFEQFETRAEAIQRENGIKLAQEETGLNNTLNQRINALSVY